MKKIYSLKVDIFPHILPPKFKEALCQALPATSYWQRLINAQPTLFNIEDRFRIMDRYEGLVQVLTIASPPIELYFDPKKSVELAKLANDEMAELVTKYQDRFLAATTCLPMNDIDASLKEVDRTIKDLGFRGIYFYTPINNKPLDSPEFIPFYEKMVQYNLPIWIHPFRTSDHADYKTLNVSKYRIWGNFGWPYETTAGMAHIVYSGILEKYPNLKFITHHCGGMVPYHEARITCHQYEEEAQGEGIYAKLTKPPINYFKMFYADTTVRALPALTCGYQFFGADHLLFGTDMPYGLQLGDSQTRKNINVVEQLDINDAEKEKIFCDNARTLLRLPIE